MDILATALAAWDAGLCVVRARPDGSKRPEGAWKEYQSRRPTRDETAAMFANGHSGIGIITGATSGNVEMFEFEGKAVQAGFLTAYLEACDRAGLGPVIDRIVNAYQEVTPSDGVHLFWRCCEVEGNLKLARRPPTPAELAENPTEQAITLIETRGEGGFAIIAPSNGTTHPTGGSWEVTGGQIDSIATITPDERRRLLDLAREFDQMPVALAPTTPRAPVERQQAPPSTDDTRPGDEFEATTTCHDVLLAAGFVEHSTDAKGTHYTRPGKEKRHGSSATVYADLGTCTLFSSSIGAPLEYLDGHKKLTAWRLHVALNHAGDFAAAARQWRSEHPRPPAGPLYVLDGAGGAVAPPAPPSSPSGCYLPDEFWDERPVLAHIRQAARARMTAPDGVLNAVLGRVAAFTPHTVDLPPLVGRALGLTYYGANVGPAEAGKSAGSGVARELIPHSGGDALDMLPLGSGEGYVEALFEYDAEEKQKIQRYHGAYFYVDEGAVLGDLSSRSGSTLLPTLRSAYTHATLGATNASKEKRRMLQGSQYVYGITLGIQPELAGPFLADAPAGTPQRFVYLRADDPAMTVDDIDWPGALGWQPPDASLLVRHGVQDAGYTRHRLSVDPTIRAEVRADRVAAQKEPRPTMEAHRTLVRLKVAALLALLEGRMDVGVDDWRLAGVVVDTSRAVRMGVEATLADVARRSEDAANARHLRRELTIDGGRASHALDVVARAMARHVAKHEEPDGCVRRCVTRAAPGKYLVEMSVDDGIANAIDKGWLVVRDGRFSVGESRPA